MSKKFKDPADPDEPFIIPEKFWDQLKEFTGGGFICFYVNNFGSIELNANFENEVCEEAVRAWASRFLNSLNQSREISETQEMLDSEIPPDDSEENQGFEE